MILLDDDEIIKQWLSGDMLENYRGVAKTQAKKILIELQSIYKLPDLKMEYDRMGEFIKELKEEVK